jgi:HlyD family secretion protein
VAPHPAGTPPGGANLLLRRFEESERVVAAGAPLVELGRLEDLEVVVDVLTTDAPLVRPGAEMLVATGGPVPLRARVLRVEPSAFTKVSPLGVEEQRVNVIAALETVEPSLGDRFRVDARIVVSRGRDVVKAPAGAVFRSGGGWAAFLLAGGRARLVSVSIGRRNPDEVEVTEGLRPGDHVIAYPPDGLDDGERVAPIPGARP